MYEIDNLQLFFKIQFQIISKVMHKPFCWKYLQSEWRKHPCDLYHKERSLVNALIVPRSVAASIWVHQSKLEVFVSPFASLSPRIGDRRMGLPPAVPTILAIFLCNRIEASQIIRWVGGSRAWVLHETCTPTSRVLELLFIGGGFSL